MWFAAVIAGYHWLVERGGHVSLGLVERGARFFGPEPKRILQCFAPYVVDGKALGKLVQSICLCSAFPIWVPSGRPSSFTSLPVWF
jgi:hypothetical protein